MPARSGSFLNSKFCPPSSQPFTITGSVVQDFS
jgi:hypothetical protein